jgi:hypothetical protein
MFLFFEVVAPRNGGTITNPDPFAFMVSCRSSLEGAVTCALGPLSVYPRQMRSLGDDLIGFVSAAYSPVE